MPTAVPERSRPSCRERRRWSAPGAAARAATLRDTDRPPGEASIAAQLPDLDFTRIGPAVGERFPDIRLADQSGEVVGLHDYRDGHRLLFVVYRSAEW